MVSRRECRAHGHVSYAPPDFCRIPTRWPLIQRPHYHPSPMIGSLRVLPSIRDFKPQA